MSIREHIDALETFRKELREWRGTFLGQSVESAGPPRIDPGHPLYQTAVILQPYYEPKSQFPKLEEPAVTYWRKLLRSTRPEKLPGVVDWKRTDLADTYSKKLIKWAEYEIWYWRARVSGRLRRAAGRNELWWKWHTEESMTNAQIRDRWNAMTDKERCGVCPSKPDEIAKGSLGSDLVKKAVRALKKEKQKS